MTMKTDERIRGAYGSEAIRSLPEQLKVLIEKWRASRAHTYASENADLYRGYDNGCHRCADELEAVLAAASRSLGAQQVIVGTCRNGASHYCPNCDRSFTALKSQSLGASPWHPIETAPKDGTQIDVWVSGAYGYRVADVRWAPNREQWTTLRGYYITAKVTHWMSLPAPPERQP